VLSLSSDDALFDHVCSICERRLPDTSLVLIGGCSRTGKSVLAEFLDGGFRKRGIPSAVLALDAWLIGIDARGPHSTVIERYETDAIVRAVGTLIGGGTVEPPVYEPSTRRRVEHASGAAKSVRGGVVVADGVIALALPELVRLAQCRIHVSIPDDIRLARLEAFYTRVKGVSRDEALAIIMARETEEVPFIKAAAARADVLFTPSVVQELS
jgi:uridine kinase